MAIRDRNIDKLSASKVSYQITTITSAQLLALNATPKIIVPAPSAGFAVVFDGAVVRLSAGTAYTIAAGKDLAVKYTDGSGLEVAAMETTGMLDQSTRQVRWVLPRTNAQGAGTTSDLVVVTDAALVAQILVGEVTLGTGTLLIKAYYRTIPFADVNIV